MYSGVFLKGVVESKGNFSRPRRSKLAGLANSPFFLHCPHTRTVDGMKTSQQLSCKAVEEFKAIYQEEFGTMLSDDEVQEIAMRLLRFFGILNRPPSA